MGENYLMVPLSAKIDGFNQMQLHPLTHSNDVPDIFDGMSLFSRMVKGKILTNFVSD